MAETTDSPETAVVMHPESILEQILSRGIWRQLPITLYETPPRTGTPTLQSQHTLSSTTPTNITHTPHIHTHTSHIPHLHYHTHTPTRHTHPYTTPTLQLRPHTPDTAPTSHTTPTSSPLPHTLHQHHTPQEPHPHHSNTTPTPSGLCTLGPHLYPHLALSPLEDPKLQKYSYGHHSPFSALTVQISTIPLVHEGVA